MFNVRLHVTTVCAMVVHVAVAGGAFEGVLFCAVLFPMKCFGCDLGLN